MAMHTTELHLNETTLPKSRVGTSRMWLAYVLGSVSIVFGLVSAFPEFKGLKPSWAQYQRFSDLFVWGLALGVAAVVVALFERRRHGFNQFVLAVILAGAGTVFSLWIGLSVLGALGA